MMKFCSVSFSSMSDNLRKMYAYMHTQRCTHNYIYIYACSHTQSHEQPYQTLHQRLRHKADFLLGLLEAIITFHTITYMITDAYLDNKLHTILLVLNNTCTGHVWYVQFTAHVAHSFRQQHLQSNHGCVVP